MFKEISCVFVYCILVEIEIRVYKKIRRNIGKYPL